MEAVRLTIPPDALRLVREYSSDRVGVHPTAVVWDEEVLRQTWTSDSGSGVEWLYETEGRRMRAMYWLRDEDGCRPLSATLN